MAVVSVSISIPSKGRSVSAPPRPTKVRRESPQVAQPAVVSEMIPAPRPNLTEGFFAVVIFVVISTMLREKRRAINM